MEENDKDLENLLSDAEPEEHDEVEERETHEEEGEEEDGDEGEEVAALTEREKALISQFTESQDAVEDDFDPSKPPSPQWETQEYQFLKEGETLDDILADPVKFNAKIAQLYNDALQKGAQLGLEATYRSLPRTVSTYAKQQIETVNIVNDFYQQNKDLVPLKAALARIAQKVGTEHPEYTLPQLLSESAKAARTIFKLKESKPVKSGKSQISPAFVTQKGGNNRVTGRKSGPKTIEDEVMDLIS